MTTDDTQLATIVDRIEERWTAFLHSWSGLTDQQMREPSVTEAWSVRDVVAHVAAWDALVVEVLPGILETGRHPEYDEANEDLDAYNARRTEEMRHLSVDDVRTEMESNHQRLLAYLKEVDPKACASNTAFRERLAADTWDHYPEHTAAIREWRSDRGI